MGDNVKLSTLQGLYNKDYEEKWTRETFKIISRKITQRHDIYHVKDFKNKPIEGSFYRNELQKVLVDDNTAYNIEKIIKTRKNKGQKELFVKWQGWPDQYNSWIPEKDMKNI